MTATFASPDTLLNELLECTLQLQKRLLEDAEPEEWNDLLEHRQSVIERLDELLGAGIALSEEQKIRYLQPAAEADRNILSMMTRKKMKLGADMANLQKSKTVHDQYGGYGSSPSAYGAFFDKRK
ncbi:hypothetical protein SK3146_03633 [Paenibacillus konkukensis]|uniref:Flagellar protein FliT n=1 Tax=Paenibacillus konkukensis TaxID=2020716 RepID=A0ABY4RPI7_9BACL|nr:DUF4194 domain-containing protein [Paenibacillus konkukensis]UQZ84387.1 hypothetical protein SK3146_03633 [Paenibacillus konkukensis]